MSSLDDLAAAWKDDDDRAYDVDAAVGAAVASSRQRWWPAVTGVGVCGVAALVAATAFGNLAVLNPTVLVAAVFVAGVVVTARRALVHPDTGWRGLRVVVAAAYFVAVAAAGFGLFTAFFSSPVVAIAGVAVAVVAAVTAVVVERAAPPWTPPGLAPAPEAEELIAAGPALGAFSVRAGSFERQARRVVLALTALTLFPAIVDGLAVIALELAPPPNHDGTSFHAPLIHLVMPWLPLAVALLAAIVTPLCFLVAESRAPQAFSSRTTWLSLVPLLALPAVGSAAGALMGDEVNSHLWGFSFVSAAVEQAVHGDNDARFFFGFTVIATVGRVLRFAAVVVVVKGLARLVSPRLRAVVAAIVVADAAVWVVSFFFERPQALRGVVDVVAAVALLLVAVLARVTTDADER